MVTVVVATAQASQKCGRGPIPGNILDQIGPASVYLVESVSTHCWGVGLDDL